MELSSQHLIVQLCLSALLCSGCGSSRGSSDAALAPRDAGLARDAAYVDMMCPPDELVLPLGTQIAIGISWVFPITTDDFVPVEKSSRLIAFSLNGGDGQIVAQSWEWMLTREKAIFTWDRVAVGPNDYFPPAPLTVWTSTTGSAQVSTASIPELARASVDGRFIFYTDNTNLEGTATDLVVSRSDGTAPVRFGLHSMLSPACVPNARFVGDKVVVNHCPSAMDGGVAGHTVLLVDLLTGVVKVLKSNAAFQPFWVDEKSETVFVGDEAGRGWSLSLSGESPVLIDGDVQDGLILPDGDAVVYRTSKGALRRADLTGPIQPVTLIGKDVSFLFIPQDIPGSQRIVPPNDDFPGIAPNGKVILFGSHIDQTTGFSDLFAASTVAPAPPISLVPTTTACLIGRPFSTDSSHVYYHSACTWVPNKAFFIGALEARDLGGMDVLHIAASNLLAWPGQDSTIAYGENFYSAPYNGRTNLFVKKYDVAGRGTEIASRVEAGFEMNPARTKVVYSLNDSQHDGVYVYDLP